MLEINDVVLYCIVLYCKQKGLSACQKLRPHIEVGKDEEEEDCQ